MACGPGRTMSIIPLYRVDTPHPQAQACAACSVRGQSLFGALDRAGLDYIHASIDSIRLQPGKTLFEAGVRGAVLYTLREGIVRFERVTERGDRRIVRLAGRGDLIGQEVLLRRPYADDAVACTPAQLCRIPARARASASPDSMTPASSSPGISDAPGGGA